MTPLQLPTQQQQKPHPRMICDKLCTCVCECVGKKGGDNQ
jgi:hypothetical protein